MADYTDDLRNLREAIREEQRRGRRPIDESLKKEKRLLVRDLLGERDEVVFCEAIRALGLKDGSKLWILALKAWRDAWRERQRL